MDPATLTAIAVFASTAYNLFTGHKQHKEAKKAYKAQTLASNEQAIATRNEQTRITKQLESEKKKVNKGITRLNAGRIKGGLFGSNSAESATASTSTLG